MPETHRTELTPSIASQANLGGLAMLASAEANPFEVNETELVDLIPDLYLHQEASQLIIKGARRAGQYIYEGQNRRERRNPPPNTLELNNFINATLWFMTSRKNSEEIKQHDFFPSIELLLHEDILDLLLTTSDSLRDLESTRQELAVSTSNLLDNEAKIDEQYTLLKAISYSDRPDLQDKDLEKEFLSENLTCRTTLASALASYGTEARQKLEDGARAGVFDKHIAYDALQLAMNSNENIGDFDKLRELISFSSSLGARQTANTPDKTDILQELTAILESWPASHRQIVIKAREAILERLDINTRRIKRTLGQNQLTFADDPEMHLYQVADEYAKSVIKNSPTQVIPTIIKLSGTISEMLGTDAPSITDLMEMRREATSHKPKRIRTSNETPTPNEIIVPDESAPKKINQLEGPIGEIIDQFLQSIKQTRSKQAREKVNTILQYMENNEMLKGHPNVRVLTNRKAKIGNGEETIYRIKPPGAANWRVAFVAYDNEDGQKALGILGIYSRKDQDKFLKKFKGA